MRFVDLLNPYAYVMRLRRTLYRRGLFKQTISAMPVISVGNLTMGGTGKTPLTLLLAQHIESVHGKKVGVLLRGYGRQTHEPRIVDPKHDGATEVGDEALAIALALPTVTVIVDADRSRGASTATQLGVEVLILDDGYQHLAIKRDVNILLIDTEEGFGTVIPFGRAREDRSAARDADIVLFTNVEHGPRAHRVTKKLSPFVKADAAVAALHSRGSELELVRTGVRTSLDLLQGARVLAVSSIAKPERFHRAVAACGAVVIVHALPDHAEYSQHTVDGILAHAERLKADLIVTTTKDAAKARGYYAKSQSPVGVVIFHQMLEWIMNEEGFFERVDNAIRSNDV